ncbi:MAG: FAD/NAD(P)-binding protein [Deltaproteobacteria bacterium]|nr:FAD/NAD(P)-binding protein [Deltaproteobacteria bacterium]
MTKTPQTVPATNTAPAPQQTGPASPYLPTEALVTRAAKLTEKERLFALALLNGQNPNHTQYPVAVESTRPSGIAPNAGSTLNYLPGQFYMVGLPGYGEAPFSVASPLGASEGLELCIRAVGNLTNAIHRVPKGGRLWIRGPFGTGFDAASMKGRDVVFIAGGIGIVPMRSLIKTIVGNPGYGRLSLIYGTKSPDDLLFSGEMTEWSKAGLRAFVTIDKPAKGWSGNVGVVTTLMAKLDIDPVRTTAVIIGPPVMYKFVIMNLRKAGMRDEDILVSLERRMKCGLGKCGHCQINGVYACQCGPVFKLSDLHGLPEAL